MQADVQSPVVVSNRIRHGKSIDGRKEIWVFKQLIQDSCFRALAGVSSVARLEQGGLLHLGSASFQQRHGL